MKNFFFLFMALSLIGVAPTRPAEFVKYPSGIAHEGLKIEVPFSGGKSTAGNKIIELTPLQLDGTSMATPAVRHRAELDHVGSYN